MNYFYWGTIIHLSIDSCTHIEYVKEWSIHMTDGHWYTRRWKININVTCITYVWRVYFCVYMYVCECIYIYIYIYIYIRVCVRERASTWMWFTSDQVVIKMLCLLAYTKPNVSIRLENNMRRQTNRRSMDTIHIGMICLVIQTPNEARTS